MKHLTLILLSWAGMTMCKRPVPPEPSVLLQVWLFDQSESYNYADTDLEAIKAIVRQRAARQPVVFTAIAVQSDSSYRQDPFVTEPMRLDTIDLHSLSIYQRKKAAAHNNRVKARFEAELSELSDALTDQYINIRSAPWTDLNGALSLAESISRQAEFADADIEIVVLSDLHHDLEEGPDSLGVFRFPSGTAVYLVGAQRQIDSEKVFPGIVPEPKVKLHTNFFTSDKLTTDD